MFKVLQNMGINDQLLDGTTALLMAIKMRNKELVKELIADGADVNMFNNREIKPIYLAIQYDDIEITDILIKSGGFSEEIIIHVKSKSMCEFLFENGYTIDFVDHHGADLATYAVDSNNNVLIDFLISKNANLENALIYSIDKMFDVDIINKLVKNMGSLKEDVLYNAFLKRSSRILNCILHKYDIETIKRLRIKTDEEIREIRRRNIEFQEREDIIMGG